MIYRRFHLAVASSIVFVGPSLGAVVALTGTEKGFWNNHAVIVCSVQQAWSDRDGNRASIAVLDVLATDFPVPTRILIDHIPGAESAIHENLEKNEIAALCIERTKDGWTLPRDGLAFFPSHSAIQRLKDANDPLINDIVEKLQAARVRRD
jgi:hypothetical protein